VRKRTIVFGLVLLATLLAGVLTFRRCGHAVYIDKYDAVDRPARIYPDYSSTVVPPSIAPLNFMVQEEGSRYFARIYSQKGEPIEVFSRSPKIFIPISRWHALLDKNRGGELHFDVFVGTDKGNWLRFDTITNKIANEDIDGYMVYRRLHPTHVQIMACIGIYQRNLRNFDEGLVLDNRHYRYEGGCVNCHAFCGNRPDKVSIGVRNSTVGNITLLTGPETANKLSVKFGYTAWHPSGRLAVYVTTRILLFFHTAKDEVRDTIDLDSMLSYFVVDTKTVRTSPGIAKKERLETWPAWSADGRYLYFCSAPMLWPDQIKDLPKEYDKVKYDLVRISYDVDKDKWGEVETVLSAQDTNLSIAMPRASPDGRWLMFCMFKYGQFPPWQPSSDLYIMDLKAAGETGRYEYRQLDIINSDQSESWHSWSSNSRWIAFSSKREHGVFTRSYISYVDETGKVYKPLVLPQKDPEFYDYCPETFNTPELVTGPIAVTGERLARVVRSAAAVSVEMPITMATPMPAPEGSQYQQGREQR